MIGRIFILVGCAVVLATSQSPAAPAPSTVRVHTVQQILRDGVPVASAAGVTVTPQGGPAQSSVRRGETIADGTRIDVPAHLVVIAVSTNGASTTRIEPGASITFVSTGTGELVRVSAGQAFFEVVHNALNFFRVQYGDQITAGVNGTAFSIVASGKTVTFACTRDAVSIVKTGFLVIGTQHTKVSLVDTISAGQAPVTYAPTQGWILASFANYPAAETSFQAQLSAAKNAGNRNAQANALDNLGIVQTEQSKYAAALQSYQQAIALDLELHDRDSEADARMGIGIVQRRENQYTSALQSYQQALALFSELGDREGEANVLGGIAIVHGTQGNDAVALASFQQALAIHHTLGDRDGEARDLGNIAVSQTHLGQLEAALQSERQALPLIRDLGDRDAEARALVNIGIVQERQGHYADALQSYTQGFAIFKALGDPNGEAFATTNMNSVRSRMAPPASLSPQAPASP
jgi:Tfp pilus assembly protein PilF